MTNSKSKRRGALLLIAVAAIFLLLLGGGGTVSTYTVEGAAVSGTNGTIAIGGNDLAFGRVPAGRTVTRYISIRNRGVLPSRFGIRVVGNASQALTVEPNNGFLLPGTETSIAVTFGAASDGVYAGSLMIQQTNLLPLVRTNK